MIGLDGRIIREEAMMAMRRDKCSEEFCYKGKQRDGGDT